MKDKETFGLLLAGADASGQVLAFTEGLSFWGGVDPKTGQVIDVHHAHHGTNVAGKIVLMPTSRGSCSGSGVLLQLALSRIAPAALIFCEDEEVLTLGAVVAELLFDAPVTVVRLPREFFQKVSGEGLVSIQGGTLTAGDTTVHLRRPDVEAVNLTPTDRATLKSEDVATRLAMEILCRMAVAQGAGSLIDVSRAHIDGCILAHDANLIFAEKMAMLGAQTVIPTTMNAISVDRDRWESQGVPAAFGAQASRLADAYTQMGAMPTFTCAPYLLRDAPARGECLGWSESNAVIFANSVLGARTAKQPDYLDLCIALTGRAPFSAVYSDEGRRAGRVIDVDVPETVDDAFWPLLGWLIGQASPDAIPLVRGVAHLEPSMDDLKGLCAAFGTTSGAPMLHLEGVTPEGSLPARKGADHVTLARTSFREAWAQLTAVAAQVDLVAIGAPHASESEVRRLASLLQGRPLADGVSVIVTLGRSVMAELEEEIDGLKALGVDFYVDLCWCSITEPLLPPEAKVIVTNSGKYAHYGFGLHERQMHYAGLEACVEAAVSGQLQDDEPAWIRL